MHQDLFIQIYNEYWNKIFQTAYSRLKDKDVAAEITQEIFTDLWERQELSKINNVESYLMTAVKFAVIDHIRHQMAERKYLRYYKTFLELHSSREYALDYQDIPELIQEGMEGLSETTQQVFVLNHLKNWKKKRIADYLQLSEKAIEYHLTKSLKTIRFFLQSVAF